MSGTPESNDSTKRAHQICVALEAYNVRNQSTVENKGWACYE
ncbi:MAG: hypothetical protein WBR18_03915 [Anaerolineales bacterium]